MKKKFLKILIICITILAILLMNGTVFATAAILNGSNLVNTFGTNNIEPTTAAGEGLLEKVIGPVLSVVRIVAIGLAIIIITYLGIKYIAAAPSEKANIKNQLVTYTIGAILVVGTTSVLSFIKDAVTSVTKIN